MQLELFMAETLFKKYRRMIVPLQKKKKSSSGCAVAHH